MIKVKTFKGDIITVFENGNQTSEYTNMDKDREVAVGDVFEWQAIENIPALKMKVVDVRYPVAVEIIEK